MSAKLIPQEVLEKKLADVDFDNAWAVISSQYYSSLKESYRAAYDAGRTAGKNEGLRIAKDAIETLR